MAKAFLSEHNVPFVEKNVQTDMDARAEMVKKSGQLGVPVIDIDGTALVGFDKGRIAELAGISD
jgi:glutaredoxin